MYRIDFADGDGDRDGAGGRPYLRDGKWPVCVNDTFLTNGGPAKCKRYGEPLTHFLRFDIREEWGTAFPAGSHFSLFLCVGCADAVIPPPTKGPWKLAKGFQTSREMQANYCNWGWWYAALDPPGAPLGRADKAEPLLQPQTLSFVVDEKETPSVGPGPKQLQGKEHYICSCGAGMKWFCFFPDEFPFPTTPDAPEQRGTYSKKKYKLFLGNACYFMACPKGCDPRAVIPYHP